jgi:hypothetical protein
MDHPDVPLPVDRDAADLAEDPVIRQRLWPGRLDREGRDFAGASRGRKRGHTDQHRGGKAGKKRFEAAGRGKDRVRAIWHWRHGFSPLFSCVVVRVSGE